MPEQLDISTIHERIQTDRAAFEEATYVGTDSIVKFRDYYRGKQPNTLTDSQKAILAGINVNNSSDNVSAQIVDEGAARLTLEMPSVQAAGDDSTEASALAVEEWIEQELWVKNHLPKVATETHRAAIRDGDFCLLPFWKPPSREGQPGRIIIYTEPWWDGSSGVYIQYDERDQMTYAVKEWSELRDNTKVYRRDVWTEDALYRYLSDSGGATDWQPFRRPDDPTFEGVAQWPIPWRKADGSPLHIPYAHFRSDRSALAGGILGQQDKLNDQGYSIAATIRMTGFQMYWASGADAPQGSDVVGPGLFKYFPMPDSRTGVYEAGDIGQMLNARDSHLQRIASAANLPTHTFSGNWPSGEALLRAERPAVEEALARAERFKPSWATLFHRATEIANVFGKVGLDENALIEAQYGNVDKLDDLKRFLAVSALYTAANTAVQAGMPLITFMREYSGWTPAKLEQLEIDLAQQQQQAEDAEEAALRRMVDEADAQARIDRQNAG